jgi:hypothetical protein
MPANLCRVKPAVAMTERLARLVLLAFTVLGVATLHTIGHGAVQSLDNHERVTVAAITAIAVPAQQDGCDGDGCTHQVAMPGGARDTSRWWEVCVAVLGLLGAALLAVALSVTFRAARRARPAKGRRRRPHPARTRPVALTLATAAVIRT